MIKPPTRLSSWCPKKHVGFVLDTTRNQVILPSPRQPAELRRERGSLTVKPVRQCLTTMAELIHYMECVAAVGSRLLDTFFTAAGARLEFSRCWRYELQRMWVKDVGSPS